MKHTLKYGSAFLSLLLMFVFCSHQLALAGEVKYKYDSTGKVKLVKQGDHQYEYHYDGNGNLLKKTKQTAVNLLENGDFEYYSGSLGLADSWGNYEQDGVIGTYGIEENKVMAGKRAQRMDASSLNGKSMSLMQTVAVEQGKNYVLHSHIKVEKISNAKVNLTLGFYDANGKVVGWPASGSISDDTKGEFFVLSTNGVVPQRAVRAAVQVNIIGSNGTGSASVVVDGMHFTYSTEPNLLANSGFESYTGSTGLADGWWNFAEDGVIGTYGIEEINVMAGMRAQRMDASSLNGKSMSLMQTVAVEQGKNYVLHSHIKVEKISNAKVNLTLGFYDANGKVVGWPASGSISDDTKGEFFVLSTNGVVPLGAVRAAVQVNIIGSNGTGSASVVVDGMHFTYSTEPNLLANSGFESYTGSTGLADGWWNFAEDGVIGTYGIDENKVMAGKRAQRMGASSLNGKSMSLMQTVAVEQGKNYVLHSHIKVEKISNAKVNLTLGFYDANGKVVGWPASGSITHDTKGEFFVLSTNGVVPQGAVRAAVQVNIIGSNGKGTASVIIDDMNLNYAKGTLPKN
ncbi:hypothetical protein RQP50_02450 [Paenibacillus sp. chi10]|uniref:YD repeat-containing protein n=1 Tax=Paenibacillus suaedae TaxID=3077233 RepID=A0AAJ2JQL4_9BACL|nr:hypothetical protein [Paenibacillus sp. chi10]MDT8975100.1 hypothetical protein [Paenibacillus sp. chi10]